MICGGTLKLGIIGRAGVLELAPGGAFALGLMLGFDTAFMAALGAMGLVPGCDDCVGVDEPAVAGGLTGADDFGDDVEEIAGDDPA